MKYMRWLSINADSLSNKRVAISGSTGGLGKEICAYLAHLGADLVLLDRNRARSEKHREELLAIREGISVELVTVDFEDIKSVKAAADSLVKMEVDIFIHNAGAYSIPRHKCSTGYDNVYQINFASPYFLIREILPMLEKKQGRVIVVGSIAHNYSHIDSRDIDFSGRDAASKVYGNAKRYLMFSLYELFRGEKNVSLAITHPGITPTNITAHYPKLIYAIIKYPMRLIFMSPRKAALSVLLGVYKNTDYHAWIGPRIFNVWGLPSYKYLHTCTLTESREIYNIAESVYEKCKEVAELSYDNV